MRGAFKNLSWEQMRLLSATSPLQKIIATFLKLHRVEVKKKMGFPFSIFVGGDQRWF